MAEEKQLQSLYRETIQRLDAMLDYEQDPTAIMATIAGELLHSVPHIHWAGFYLRRNHNTLVLGPYQGGHGCSRIQIGRGVCGHVAQTGETALVDDVNAFSDHIACSASTQSELVIPLLNPAREVIGVLDLDSDNPAAFSRGEAQMLESFCEGLTHRLPASFLGWHHLHQNTPLVNCASRPGLSYKLDALQPSGSFKIRGIGSYCQHYAKDHQHFMIASGGNAGLATAYAAHHLGKEATVVIPVSTPKTMQSLLQHHGANVIVHGNDWAAAHRFVKEQAQNAAHGTKVVHPFDDPIIWQGHASLIDELVAADSCPETIVVAVGGGGLLCGIREGLRRHNWHERVKVVAVETEGAHSLKHGLEQLKSGHQPAPLAKISSKAHSLGAPQVCQQALAECSDPKLGLSVELVTISDEAAAHGCRLLLERQRLGVELAAGAAVQVADGLALQGSPKVLAVVCGGSGHLANGDHL